MIQNNGNRYIAPGTSGPGHIHDWSEVGLANHDGTYSFFCHACDDELIISPKGKRKVVSGGFKPAFDFDEPARHGSVGKIITREIMRDYRLEGFEIREGDVVVDIGAHIGLVSIYLAKKYPQAKILAYEPLQANFEYLVRNLRLAGVKNVIAHPMAVTADGREVILHGDPAVNSGEGSIYRIASRTAEIEAARSISVGEVLEEAGGSIKLLKLDAEFAEYEILPALDLAKVEYLRGEFHRGMPNASPETLFAYCCRFMDPKKIKVSVS